MQDRLVLFDGQDVLAAACEEVGGKLVLGPEGIGGNGLPGDVQRVENRDGLAISLVGLKSSRPSKGSAPTFSGAAGLAPVAAMGNAPITGFVIQHASIEALLRAPPRNPTFFQECASPSR